MSNWEVFTTVFENTFAAAMAPLAFLLCGVFLAALVFGVFVGLMLSVDWLFSKPYDGKRGYVRVYQWVQARVGANGS